MSYAGTPAIERDVVENVASFGDQLGTLIDAVVELAGERSGKELDDLRELKTKVDEVKERHKRDMKREREGGDRAPREARRAGADQHFSAATRTDRPSRRLQHPRAVDLRERAVDADDLGRDQVAEPRGCDGSSPRSRPAR